MKKQRSTVLGITSSILTALLLLVGTLFLLAQANRKVEQQVIDNLSSATLGDRIVCEDMISDLPRGTFTFSDVTYTEPPEETETADAPAEEPVPQVVLTSDAIVVDYPTTEIVPMLLGLERSDLHQITISAEQLSLQEKETLQIDLEEMEIALEGDLSSPDISAQHGEISSCKAIFKGVTMQNTETRTCTKAGSIDLRLEGKLSMEELEQCMSELESISIICSDLQRTSETGTMDYEIEELRLDMAGAIKQAVLLGDIQHLFGSEGSLELTLKGAVVHLREHAMDTIQGSDLAMDLTGSDLQIPLSELSTSIDFHDGEMQMRSLSFSCDQALCSGDVSIASLGESMLRQDQEIALYTDIICLLEPVIGTMTGALPHEDLGLSIKDEGTFDIKIL